MNKKNKTKTNIAREFELIKWYRFGFKGKLEKQTPFGTQGDSKMWRYHGLNKLPGKFQFKKDS